MAEAAGLALGGIALASLFSACVEVLEVFESGRDWLYDFSLAQTKVNLMKLRLSQLGDNMQTGISLEEEACFPQNSWRQESGTVCDGLLGITEILGKTAELCRRYSYATDAEPITQRSNCSMRVSNHAMISFARSPSGPRILSTISKKVCWAVHDKKKFEVLISDFEFILSNLERIIDGLENYKSPDHYVCSIKDYTSWPTERLPINMIKSPTTTKAESRPTTADQATVPASISAQRELLRSSQPQVLGNSRAVGVFVSSWTNNESRDQSVHIIGPQVDDNNTFERSRPAIYDKNISYDQSLAITSPIDAKTFATVTSAWLELAKHAVDKKI